MKTRIQIKAYDHTGRKQFHHEFKVDGVPDMESIVDNLEDELSANDVDLIADDIKEDKAYRLNDFTAGYLL